MGDAWSLEWEFYCPAFGCTERGPTVLKRWRDLMHQRTRFTHGDSEAALILDDGQWARMSNVQCTLYIANWCREVHEYERQKREGLDKVGQSVINSQVGKRDIDAAEEQKW